MCPFAASASNRIPTAQQQLPADIGQLADHNESAHTLRHVTRDWDAPEGASVFDSPEEAALSQWAGTPNARAAVVDVRPAADDGAVWVTIQTDGAPGFHDQDVVTCMQTAEGRWWAGGSTGASSGR